MRFDCFGLIVEFAEPCPFSADELRQQLPLRPAGRAGRANHHFSFQDADRASAARLHVRLDGIPWRTFRGRTAALRETAAQARQLVAVEAPVFTFVHAGVVAINGRALVIAGRSRSGKSRMVEALLAEGATYYSDEYAVFDSRGRVHAFTKPLSIRRSKGQPARAIPVADLVRQPPPAIPVGLVVRSTYRRGARFDPEPLPSGLAALHLLGNAIAGRSRGPEVLQALTRGVASASFLSGRRGEASRASKTLLALLLPSA